MTEDQTRTPTLDDVRERFLDAETSLAAIGTSLERLDGAAAGISAARHSIDDAGVALREVAGGLSENSDRALVQRGRAPRGSGCHSPR